MLLPSLTASWAMRFLKQLRVNRRSVTKLKPNNYTSQRQARKTAQLPETETPSANLFWNCSCTGHSPGSLSGRHWLRWSLQGFALCLRVFTKSQDWSRGVTSGPSQYYFQSRISDDRKPVEPNFNDTNLTRSAIYMQVKDGQGQHLRKGSRIFKFAAA